MYVNACLNWAVCLSLEYCVFPSCMFKLNTIYHHAGVTACTADGKSAWIQVSQLQCSLQYTTWQFLTTQLCRCENLCLKYPTDTRSSSTISPNPGSRDWKRGWQFVENILNTCCWSSSTNMQCLYFIVGRSYCKLSSVGFCWYRPSFCVPSSFHWLDLKRLLAEYQPHQLVSSSCWNFSAHLSRWLNLHYAIHTLTHTEAQQFKATSSSQLQLN